MRALIVWMLACGALFAACSKTPPPPSIDQPSAPVTITGGERIGWDQRAAGSTELSALRYAIYVDGSRSELGEVSCASDAGANGFACSAKLPALSSGAHTLELASFIVDKSLIESARSAVLNVNVVSVEAQRAVRTAPDPAETVITTRDGETFRLERVADDLQYPTDVAFPPDGRLFVAEREGHLRTIPGRDRDVVVSQGRLLALALDPQFPRTHYVYVIYTAPSPNGTSTFSLARLRETSNTFGDRIVLVDGIPAAPVDPAAALRIGPDGKLYAAFDDAGDPAAAEDLASWNGKVLRLNTDGSTPDDQPSAAPLYAIGFRSPRGLAWAPRSGVLWIADARNGLRAIPPQTIDVPRGDPASALTFLGDDLVLASPTSQHLRRIRFDGNAPPRTISQNDWLANQLGPVRLVSADPDGALYIADDHTLERLVPAAKR